MPRHHPPILRILLLILACQTVHGALRIALNDYDSRSWKGVLKRNTPEWVWHEFEDVRVKSAKEHGYQLPKQGLSRIGIDELGHKTVLANTPVDALYAINSYLRSECLSQISWSNSSFSDGCRRKINEVVDFEAKQIRYFGNMCTFSYSFAWWQWSDWEKFIDWIALNGFNMVLMPLGQEAVWKEVFEGLGVERQELDRYFTSQAYLAWHRMGNLKGYGGGLSDAQMINDLNLAKQIIDRFSELGITPILPTFAGFVPDQMQKLFPQSKFTRLPCWNNFSSDASCLLSVSPYDPLFSKIATSFLRMQKKMIGDVTNLYSADPFNEVLPSESAKLDFVKQTAEAILSGCRKVDKNCIWVLQSWSFAYDKWPAPAIKSFLQAIPHGSLIVLDLYAEVVPMWQSTSSFYGHYFVWCMLHNFGGTRELRGNLAKVDKGYQQSLMKSGSNMIGGGLSMEAIDQNYIIYQFMIDRIWSPTPILQNSWLQSYSESRYSMPFKYSQKLWNLLSATFYNQPEKWGDKRFSVFLYHRPDFGKRIDYWFDVEDVFERLETIIPVMVEVLGKNPHFQEDVNDILREILQFRMANEAYLPLSEAYMMEDKQQIEASCENLMEMFEKLDGLGNRDLNEWIESSKSIAASPEELETFPMTARDILTTWGPNGQNLDYGRREWHGMVQGYYAKRWEHFCEWILQHDVFNRTAFGESVFWSVERPFLMGN